MTRQCLICSKAPLKSKLVIGHMSEWGSLPSRCVALGMLRWYFTLLSMTKMLLPSKSHYRPIVIWKLLQDYCIGDWWLEFASNTFKGLNNIMTCLRSKSLVLACVLIIKYFFLEIMTDYDTHFLLYIVLICVLFWVFTLDALQKFQCCYHAGTLIPLELIWVAREDNLESDYEQQ